MSPWLIRLVFLAVALANFYGYRHPEKTRLMYWWGNPPDAYLKGSSLTLMLTALAFFVASFFMDFNSHL